jgi:hypothetical protein
VALGQVSFGYFGFPCQFSFHRMLRTHLQVAPISSQPWNHGFEFLVGTVPVAVWSDADEAHTYMVHSLSE